jgi:hypothetical protein
MNEFAQELVQEEISIACREIEALLLRKNKDYGNSAIEPIRIFSTCDPLEQINVRIDDKLSRICNIARNGAVIEEDTEDDLIGYLIIKKVRKKLEQRAANPKESTRS